MTSKSSFLVRSRENHKRRIWVWIVSLLGNMAVYPGIMTVYLSRIKYWKTMGNYNTEELYRMQLQQAATDALGFCERSVLLVLLLGLVIGMQGFIYLHDRKKVDMYHSVPVAAKKRFMTVYLNGIAIYLIPFLGSILIAIIMAATQGAVNVRMFEECGLAIALNILYFLIVYQIAILAVLLTGNQIIAGFAVCTLLFAEGTVLWLFETMKLVFFKTSGRAFTESKVKSSIVVDYYFKAEYLKKEESLPEIGKTVLQLCGKWLVVAVILFVLVYLCYKKRPAEAAGRAIAFRQMKPFLKIILSVIGGVMICRVVYSAAYYSVPLTALGTLIGTILCAAVMEAIFEFDIRGAVKHLATTGISAAIAVLIFVIYYFDIFGYDAYIPDAEKVESVAVYTSYDSEFWEVRGQTVIDWPHCDAEDYVRRNMFLTDVDAVIELAKKYQGMNEKETEDARYITVLYRLKSGREVSRSFLIELGDTENAGLLDRVVGTREYREGTWQIVKDDVSIQNKNLVISYTNGAVEWGLPFSDAGTLREAWLKDMEQYDFSLVRNNRKCGELEFRFASGYREWSLPVYENFTNTIAYLEEHDAYVPVKLQAEDIASIEITNWHYDEEEEDTEAVSSRAGAVASEVSDIGAVLIIVEEPEEIAQIVENIYPVALWNYWSDSGEFDKNYDITIIFKPNGTLYGKGYYNYKFLNEKVPDFVAERTSN